MSANVGWDAMCEYDAEKTRKKNKKMKQYSIKFDLGSSFLTYVYEESDEHIKLAFSVYNDFELANRIVKLLNKEESKEEVV